MTVTGTPRCPDNLTISDAAAGSRETSKSAKGTFWRERNSFTWKQYGQVGVLYTVTCITTPFILRRGAQG